MQIVTSRDGAEIAVWRSGSGPPLLLVHGMTADHSRWDRVAPALAAHHTVFTIDRRGRGESGDRPDYALAREAEDVAAVLDYIGEPAHLLGHSYGAMCALEATFLTDRIQRLILYEPPLSLAGGGRRAAIAERIDDLIAENRREDALVVFLLEAVHVPPQNLDAMRSHSTWPARIAAADTIPRELRLYDLYHFDAPRFAYLHIPTMLLLGGESSSFFVRATEALHSALPDSRVVRFAHQQHVAMDTAPDLFAREVLAFLAENGSRPKSDADP